MEIYLEDIEKAESELRKLEIEFLRERGWTTHFARFRTDTTWQNGVVTHLSTSEAIEAERELYYKTSRRNPVILEPISQ
jgi:hypothetical protein